MTQKKSWRDSCGARARCTSVCGARAALHSKDFCEWRIRLEGLRSGTQEILVGHFFFTFWLYSIDNKFGAFQMRIQNLHTDFLTSAFEKSVSTWPTFKRANLEKVFVGVI